MYLKRTGLLSEILIVIHCITRSRGKNEKKLNENQRRSLLCSLFGFMTIPILCFQGVSNADGRLRQP